MRPKASQEIYTQYDIHLIHVVHTLKYTRGTIDLVRCTMVHRYSSLCTNKHEWVVVGTKIQYPFGSTERTTITPPPTTTPTTTPNTPTPTTNTNQCHQQEQQHQLLHHDYQQKQKQHQHQPPTTNLTRFVKGGIRCFHALQAVAEERVEKLESRVRGVPPDAPQQTARISLHRHHHMIMCWQIDA